MTLPFGIDVSAAQGKMDFNKVASNAEKVQFVAARTGISWGYTDKWFQFNWAEMKRIGVYRVAYHVIYFGEDATRQMDNMFRAIGSADWRFDRLCLDLEVDGGFSKSTITATARKCMEIATQRTGLRVINYSRASWINQFLDVRALPGCDWWLAGYRTPLPAPLYTFEATPPPILPLNVANWTFHQTSSRSKAIGAESYFMDYDRFNGSDLALATYFGNPQNEPPTPPEVPLEEKVERLWIAHPEVH